MDMYVLSSLLLSLILVSRLSLALIISDSVAQLDFVFDSLGFLSDYFIPILIWEKNQHFLNVT